VVATVVTANTLAVVVKGYLLLLFHIVFQKYYFLGSKKVLELFLLKSYFLWEAKNIFGFFLSDAHFH